MVLTEIDRETCGLLLQVKNGMGKTITDRFDGQTLPTPGRGVQLGRRLTRLLP